MLGFVRLFSLRSGAALRPPKRSFPPLQYRFEAFFSLVDPPKEQRFKRAPQQDDISNVTLAEGSDFKSTPVATRDNPSRFRGAESGRAATLKKPTFSSFALASSLVRLSASHQNRGIFQTVTRAHSASWGKLSNIAQCNRIIWE